MTATVEQPWEQVRRELCGDGPVSPAVQMRKLLAYARQRGWEFDYAWQWSHERVKWPHDTAHRWEWKGILGQGPDDPRRMPTASREAWRSAYERAAAPRRVESVSRLVAV